MPLIEGDYVGNTYGTHPSFAYLQVKKEAEVFTANLSINHNNLVSEYSGTFANKDPIEIELDPKGLFSLYPKIRIFNVAISETGDSFRASYDGAPTGKGIIEVALRLNLSEDPANKPREPTTLAQLHKYEEKLGSITIYKNELLDLVETIKVKFGEKVEPAITVKHDNKTSNYYAKDFFKLSDLPEKIHDLSITVEQRDISGTTQFGINFSREYGNNIVAQSKDVVWARGILLEFKDLLRPFSGIGTSYLSRFGPQLNGILLLSVLILVPDFEISERFYILTSVVAVIFFLGRYYKKISSIIFLDKTERSRLRRQWPSIFIGLFVALFGGLIGILLDLIFSNQGFLDLLKNLFGYFSVGK